MELAAPDALRLLIGDIDTSQPFTFLNSQAADDPCRRRVRVFRALSFNHSNMGGFNRLHLESQHEKRIMTPCHRQAGKAGKAADSISCRKNGGFAHFFLELSHVAPQQVVFPEASLQATRNANFFGDC